MNGAVQVELRLHEHKLEALTSALAEQGLTVEERMQDVLTELYVELVPPETRMEVRERIAAERSAEQAAIENSQRCTAFRVQKDGTEVFFRLDQRIDFLEAASYLHRYLRQEQGLDTAAPLQRSLAGLGAITAEQYDQLATLRLKDPDKVAGIFDLDFDGQEVSIVDAAGGWRTWSMQDVSAAVCHAYKKSCLSSEQHMVRSLDELDGKEIASAGHLSARDISFAEEISEIGPLLNFYMEVCFDVDAVFGTHVCTGENDDTLNVYANYDMVSGQVCDELEVDLHWADGREEAVAYRLNAVEKATLLRKMDAYCQQQTGQTLKEYSTQCLAEDMTLPTQPTM